MSAKTVLPDGTQVWYLNGQLHREDGPAVIGADGYQEWHLNGQQHREDGPAFIRPDGTQAWYLNGQLHREGGPARIWPDGTQAWYLNGTGIPTGHQTGWVCGSLRKLRGNPEALFAVLAAGLKQRKIVRQ